MDSKGSSETKLEIPAENLDNFNNHEISYTEFLMATVFN